MKRTPIERVTASVGILLILALWLLPTGSLMESRFVQPTTSEAPMAATPPVEIVEYESSVEAEIVSTPARSHIRHIPQGYTQASNDLKYQWMRAAGIDERNFQFVNFIVQKESGFNHLAINLSSSAQGLCQALPGTKMAIAGADWETNPVTQLRWCDMYAKQRYGGWGNAYRFWVSNHWW